MLHIHRLSTRDAITTRSMTLRFEHRKRSRLRARLDDGQLEVVLVEEASPLELVLNTPRLFLGGIEGFSRYRRDDPWLLARAAYHLGNRHVPLQIEEGRLRYEHDHVLDDLVRSLGLEVQVERGPFEPEGGSYGGGRRHHDHDHDHDHDHANGRS